MLGTTQERKEKFKKHLQNEISNRIKSDHRLKITMMQSFLELLISGDEPVARLKLRDIVNGTIGFQELGRRLKKNPKSLMRMLSVDGNPTSENLFNIFRALKDELSIDFKVSALEADIHTQREQ